MQEWRSLGHPSAMRRFGRSSPKSRPHREISSVVALLPSRPTEMRSSQGSQTFITVLTAAIAVLIVAAAAVALAITCNREFELRLQKVRFPPNYFAPLFVGSFSL